MVAKRDSSKWKIWYLHQDETLYTPWLKYLLCLTVDVTREKASRAGGVEEGTTPAAGLICALFCLDGDDTGDHLSSHDEHTADTTESHCLGKLRNWIRHFLHY